MKSCLIVMSIIMGMSGTAWAETCIVKSAFSPYDKVETIIDDYLRTAKTSLHGSLFGIANEKLTTTLVEKAKSGVDVVFGLDKMQAAGKYDRHKELEAVGAKVVIKPHVVLEHNKFVVIDAGIPNQELVIMGSWNWSEGAKKQDNSIVILSGCPIIIQSFEKAFARIIKRDIPKS